MSSRNKIKINVDIREENFDINSEISFLTDGNCEIGAVVSFLGLVRDLSKSEALKFMEIEHYPGMSEKVLVELCEEVGRRWSIAAISLIHRIGKLYPTENIVLLLVASAHRTEAFNAAEFMMDFLKSKAPFWKKETTSAGSRWIEEASEDKEKLLRWS